MIVLTTLTAYSDERGNRIVYEGDPIGNVKITFRGANNTLTVAQKPKLGRLNVSFDCDNGTLSIGGATTTPAFSAHVQIGQDSAVRIGSNVSSTSICAISAREGTTVSVGDDVMIASNVQIRADDAHAIFDVRTGKRVNVSRPVSIGNHVWLGYGVVVLGGVTIGDGSMLGIGSIVTKSIPNNCVAAGNPARVLRRDTVWDRPHLSLSRPFYKPEARGIKNSPYWKLTVEDAAAEPAMAAARSTSLRRGAAKLKRMLSRALSR